jgi:hypothetical protein
MLSTDGVGRRNVVGEIRPANLSPRAALRLLALGLVIAQVISGSKLAPLSESGAYAPAGDARLWVQKASAALIASGALRRASDRIRGAGARRALLGTSP